MRDPDSPRAGSGAGAAALLPDAGFRLAVRPALLRRCALPFPFAEIAFESRAKVVHYPPIKGKQLVTRMNR